MTVLELDVVPEHLPNQHFSRIAPEVQGPHHWQPPTGTLGALIDRAYDRARQLDVDALKAAVSATPAPPSFADALRRDDVAIIAEIKRRSPSQGDINPSLDPVARARA